MRRTKKPTRDDFRATMRVFRLTIASLGLANYFATFADLSNASSEAEFGFFIVSF